MIRRGYEKPRSFTVSNMKANVGGWQNKSREYGAVTPPRPRKTLRRSSSFSNDVDIPPLSRQDRALIPAVPRFEQSIKSQDVKEGAPACLTCKVFGNPFPTVSWLRNRKALSLHDNRIKDDVDEDGQCSLNFRSVLAEDRGSYTCVAINHLGKVNCSALLNVHIAGGFPNRGFSSVKAPVTNAGRRETKIQKGVASHRAPGSGQNSCGESIKSSDSGISRPSSRDTSSADFYPVFSDNISSSSQAYLRKNKETSMGDRAPQFSSTPRSKVVEEGHSVLFQCHVEGAPKPLASWYKGNSKLKDSERIVLSEKINGDCSLEIVDLKATDAGSYRCVAMNRAGKSSVSVELMLAAKAGSHSSNECPPSFSQPLTDVDVNEGSRARFECKVDARPKPTVEWMKDGELITASSRVRIMEVYGTHSLVLSRTDHGDTGTYTINASNHVGSESCSAQLRVKESSYSSRGSTPKGLRSGHGSSEVVTPTYSSSSSPATSAMSSPSMSPKLGRAINSRPVTGSVTSPWSTDLKSRSGGVGGGASQRRRAPGFILRPRPQTVAPGEKLVLKCTLLGHPKPNVTWDRDGCKLDESDDRIHLRDDGSDYFLELADCSSSDSGKYTVSAKNSLGKQSATVDIIVSGTGGSTGKNRTTSSISVSRTNHHDISDSLNNNNKSPIPRNIKSQRIEVTINSKNVNTATNENRESERKHPRDFILPPHSNKEDVKPSSTSSYSSYTSSVSRMSTSSSRSASSSNDESPSHRSKRSKQVAPTFTRRLSSTQVLEGEELELNCEITGSPTPEMTWTRNGLPISQRDSSSNIEFKDGVARLKVSHIQSSQAGEYVCLAKNELGNTKCSSRVTVKPKPKQVKPKFTRLPKDIRISEGETLSLEAEVSGQPTAEVLWSLDGQEISNGECTYRNNIAKLILHDVTLACSGQYMCTAINDAGEDYAACRVRIKQKKLDIPPEFTAPLSDVKTKQGDDVCLRCMVTGIPEPRVQWLFNDEVLDGGEGIEITYHDGVAALTLDMATAEDTGCYSCIAVNTEGKSTTSCQVVVSELSRQAPVVKIAPEFVTRFEDYIRAMEGDCVTLTCKVKGTPDPEITWKINDKVVRDAKISFENGQASFVLDPISSDHAGNVVCLAKNSSGQTKHEGRLYVRAKREAPCFVTQLAESVEVQEGKEVTFGGQIKGHPQPRVSWTRNGRSLSVLNTETSYEEGKASVRIRKAGTSDAGRYVCTARNLSGETESSCMVTVVQREATQKPEFKKKLADMNLNEGQDIRLVCEVTGLPIPAISWVLDGQKLEEEDGEAAFKNGVATMLMEDAMTEDSGVYECVAKNSEGEARTRCNVKVTSAKKAAKPAEEGPSFPIQLEDMTINENEDIVVSCQVKGNPKPTITWLLDGEPIPDAECKYSDDGNAQLFLPEALPEDEGVYTCIAQNHLNRVMCSCKVTVKAIPKTKRKQTSSKEAEPSHVESKTKVETSRPSWSPKKSAREMSEVESPKTTPTSSRVNINGKAEKNRKYGRPISSEDEDQPVQKREGPDRPPKFIEELQDITVPDGSINYKLVARVSGMPPPSVKWYVDDSEIEESDEFRYETDGDKRILIFAEIFPEDSGTYTCVALNSVGEVKSKMKISVEEIDGDPPIFILKPRPLTVNAGDSAVFTCKVDGEPVPTLQWLYCNQPIAETERITITPADAQNNYIHSLEVQEVRIEDAGRYAACCKNLLGDITCTVSMIVNAPKNQEEKKDFRNVLKHSASTKSKQGETPQAEQVDFRGVLKRQVETNATPESNQAKSEDAPDFREALSRPVRTKVLTEEERKLQRAEQKDFRANLVRKVDTKTVTNEVLKVKSPSQKDFRDEALKTKVKTKEYAEDVIKQKHAEQKDFRSEALKTKVTTKAYKEENMKAMRAEQVDFREVLSPTNKRQLSKEEISSSEAPKFELSGTPAKMKLNKEKMEHNTVATRRTRARGGVVESTRRTKSSEEEVPKGKAPVFSKEIKDKKVNDATPFELVCHVVGNPQPKVSWFLGDEEIQSEADISITREGGVCKLAVAESFPDDEGTYLCRAENEYGVAQCSAHVTVVTDGELECEHDN